MPVYLEKENKWTKDGKKYQFRCYYTDIYGNRKQKESGLFLKKKEAEEAERNFLSSVNSQNILSVDVSFQNVYDDWISFKRKKVRSTTLYSRKLTVKKYILEYFKDYKLHSIKISQINKWSNHIFSLDNISLNEKNRIIGLMQEILKLAEDNYDFDKKVTSKLVKQNIERTTTTKDSEINFWTYDEFKSFIQVVDNKLYYLMFNFLYYTGLRFGEFNALTWKDIDLEKKTVTINKTLSTKFDKEDFKPKYKEANEKKLNVVEGKDYIITDPKTQNSFRTINLDDELVSLLKEHKESESKIMNFNENFFVFGNVRFFAKTTFKTNLDKYISKANIKRITPHGFRHSHVSLLIYLGCDIYEVADRIGDTPSEVEETYYHMFPDKKKHTIDVINNLKIKKNEG
ncbi:MAG: site-specific integrase [Bacilli bacterium]|nr:site-specific integrase [Bacilli bacterium]